MATNEPDSSLTDILELLIHYKADNKQLREKGNLILNDKSQMNQTIDMTGFSTLSYASKRENKNAQVNLHHSLEKIDNYNPKSMMSKGTISNTTIESSFSKQNQNIFDRLYQEKKTLEKKREKLFLEGRRSLEQKQIRQCTFSPNMGKSKANKALSPSKVYQKNLQWLAKKQKDLKKKQCEKVNENSTELTFTPRIHHFLKKQKTNKQNSQLEIKSGVKEFLNRQKKAKTNQQYIEERKKNPYSHVWNKKGYFSIVK